MSTASSTLGLFRARSEHGHHRVTSVELFFDLVFVFAVTQLSHKLLGQLNVQGAVETAILMLGVWWVWIYTSWVTNWLDPERGPVRVMLIVLMLAALVLAAAIPEAFGARGVLFAFAHAGMQVGRTLFMLLAIRRRDAVLHISFVRILFWLATAAVFWILGGFSDGSARFAYWCVALAIEYVAPAARYWVPVIGASRVADWAIEGGHMAERAGLFIIISLGESVLVTGATFAQTSWSTVSFVAFVVAFLGSVAMWWIYFDSAADVGVTRITHAKDPGGIARLAYTYLHLPIVGGIILSAVGDEISLAHATHHADLATASCVIGGPLLYVAGALSFKRVVRGWFQLSHLAACGALCALFFVAGHLSVLALSTLVTLVLITVAVWESLSLRSRQGAQASAPAHE